MPDTTPPRPAMPRSLGDRERFVAFAFAAAELLVETDLDGRITFATGAFRARLGVAPETLEGTLVTTLLAQEDADRFATELAVLPSRGRLLPATLHLADRGATPMVASGLHLALPGQPSRLCLTFALPPTTGGVAEIPLLDGPALLRDAERRLRAGIGGAPANLNFIEISGQPGAPLLAQLRAALGNSPVQITELAPGRFGLLARPGFAVPDAAALGAESGGRLSVRQLLLPLMQEDLGAMQAVRALRHGLTVFAREGLPGLREEGFDSGLRGCLDKIARRTRQLTRAVADHRFDLVYQPIVGLADGVLHHHEALLRPHRGVLGDQAGPAEFVNLAETVGLTEDLDIAVLTQALEATSGVRAGESIAVNLSGLSMQSVPFRERLLAMLDANAAATTKIMIELTESAEIEDEAEAAATLMALRERGVATCLDDFGAGAAAFRYLKAFQVDYVKVDGAFVEAAMHAERDRSFVSAMVDLSLAVGAQVIAERIETPAHAALMQRLGVGYGQGWHFGRPGPLPPLPAAPVRARRGAAREEWG